MKKRYNQNLAEMEVLAVEMEKRGGEVEIFVVRMELYSSDEVVPRPVYDDRLKPAWIFEAVLRVFRTQMTRITRILKNICGNPRYPCYLRAN